MIKTKSLQTKKPDALRHEKKPNVVAGDISLAMDGHRAFMRDYMRKWRAAKKEKAID
jgi:hypothetical protein